MKLQLQNDNLRVRIDEAELTALQAGETLRLALGRMPDPLFSLRVVLGEALSLQSGASSWQLAMPRTAIHDYVRTLPNRHALELPLLDEGQALTLQFEVDVRDSLQVRGARRRTKDTAVDS